MTSIQRSRLTIGLIAGWQAYSGTLHSFLETVIRGVRAAARTYDCNLLISCGVNSPFSQSEIGRPAWPTHLPETDFLPVGPWNTDGMVTIAPVNNLLGIAYFQDLIDQGFPVVFAGDHLDGPSVTVDNEGGIQDAIAHLVSHGHERIAFLSGYDVPGSDSEARLRGYHAGLARLHLPLDPDLIVSGQHAAAPSYEATRALLQRGKPFTALICSNDDSALGAMQALRDAGKIVPQDVALIGFDDRSEARAQNPLLTTVHHPMFELGYESFDLLMKIMQGEAPRLAKLKLPTHLVIRETCGCLPGEASNNSRQPGNGKSAIPNHVFQAAVPVRAQFAVQEPAASWVVPDDLTQVARAMAENTFKEVQHLSRVEVEDYCYRLLEAFLFSLKHGNTADFHHAVQQILERVGWEGDDLYAWQSAITVLKEMYPALLDTLPYTLPASQMDNMLHQARIAISEVSRGQYSRLLVRQSAVASDVGRMTARFFAARNEAEVFKILDETLTGLGIQNAAVVDFAERDGDPTAVSQLKWPVLPQDCPAVFDTQSFPPPGLYPKNRPYHLTLLPLVGLERQRGYVAYEANDLSALGTITQQLVSALRSVYLYQQVDEARQAAEEARHVADSARQAAEEANEMKSRFLSIVSHELRTPLNLIFGLSNIMLEEATVSTSDGDTCTVDRNDLERVYIGAQHLESLIRDVLDLARSDIGQLKLICEPLNLNEVLNAVAKIGEHMARDKELLWQTEIPPALPRVYGDRTRLRQVILNLVNNALKFTIRGSITLSAQAENGHILIAVHDTGLGIPLEEQQAIFGEFQQSSRTTARGFGGIGLGLAVCKRLVDLHHGEISVTSSGGEGSGSTFSIRLPVLNDYAKEEVEEPTGPVVELPRVLLLVSHLETAAPLEKHLARQGFRVETHSLTAAVDWTAWLGGTLPDRIILDRDAASLRGAEIMKTISDNPATKGIPILFYTLEQDSGALLDLNYLTKPLQTTDLAAALLARGLVDEAGVRTNGRAGAHAMHKSILIVDDDPIILDLHERTLHSLSSHYRILRAQNGREALERIRAERPALVLLDLMMPEVDGFGVLEAIQQDERLRGIPVIVLSSQALTEEDMARLNGSAAAVLGKGMFTRQETLAHITAALSRKRRPNAEPQRVVTRAMAFIHQGYVDPITRGDIAAYVGLSERHLTRCFNQELGITPMTYLNRFRVRQARIMLEAGERCITDIAMQVGFSTSGYFARVFKEEVGVTPREYLQRQGESLEDCS